MIVCCALALSHVWLFVILWTVAHQAPLTMGFSRQEYWNRLPYPPLGDLPNPGIEPKFPTSQANSLLSEPPGKPMNTGVGSQSLLQGIFPTQELNQGLQHCRCILYELSYQGSPILRLGSGYGSWWIHRYIRWLGECCWRWERGQQTSLPGLVWMDRQVGRSISKENSV